LIKVV
jgi:hypothetical protein